MYGTGAPVPVFIADKTDASVANPKFKEDGGEIVILFTLSIRRHLYWGRCLGQYPETNDDVMDGSNDRCERSSVSNFYNS